MNQDINTVSPWVINGALLMFAAGLTFITTLYFKLRKEAADKLKAAHEASERIRDRLTELESKLTLINAAVIPISTAFQAILIKELTHPHTAEMDALLVKVGPPNILTEAEKERLATMLVERSTDMEITDSERDAALILPAVMKRAEVEQDTLKVTQDLKLQLISITEVIGVPVPKE